MKNKILIPVFVIELCISMINTSFGQIANNFPNDVQIQTDPNVIFSEMFEATSLSAVLANWNGNTGSTAIALDATTSPPNSPGGQSIRLFTTGATTTGTPGPSLIRTAYMRKSFPSFIGDTVFARWYVIPFNF